MRQITELAHLELLEAIKFLHRERVLGWGDETPASDQCDGA